MSMIRSTCD